MSLPAPYEEDCLPRPVRVAIANDFPLVIAGTAQALKQYADAVAVVEYDSGTLVKSDVDVVLFDAFAETPGAAAERVAVLGQSLVPVLVFTWLTDPAMVAGALAGGAAGVVSKTVTAEVLVDALQRVHRGEHVTPASGHRGDTQSFGRWPGGELGLTARESEVLALICEGLSNQDIGAAMYLGANTVKSYIRSLYRKISVQTRSQAVIWGLSNGFTPQKVRGYPK